MEIPSTTIISCPKLPSKRSLMFANPPSFLRQGASTRKYVVKAKKDDHDQHGGKIVDDNMIILRMRIKEMKMMESDSSNDHHQPPLDWMEWEKKYFTTYYNEDIVEGIGLLQSYLMNTRPSLALGMLALLALSVPISASFLIVEVMDLVKSLASGFHFP
ncbi:OLC1v1010669C1 [Oldenlandia corymbosa var. corymbosa]|uniref:OLC1v1010669C1 n=1 Tax=Oldenlandia corymbosa var. corymbosa TaxID=529605 RepID=A0AAV1DV38_OLDCO|nr:OLC1v1010669C1 [Oldenlandia corymbosa var. corymbosa]